MLLTTKNDAKTHVVRNSNGPSTTVRYPNADAQIKALAIMVDPTFLLIIPMAAVEEE